MFTQESCEYRRAVTNPGEIANEFNEYFVNIGRLLSEQITYPHTSKDYLGDKSNVLFVVSAETIVSVLKFPT